MKSEKKRFTLDLEPLFQRRLKVTAALKGVSMRQYCLAAIEQKLAIDEVDGAIALLSRDQPIERRIS